MIQELRGEQGWEYCEESHSSLCEYCHIEACYSIGPLTLCLSHLMKLRAEIVRIVPFPLNEGT